MRIAEELLDRIVVQRSRALCKEIERQQDSDVELLFRPDQGIPEKLYYSDEYDGIEDVLARFLPLFDTPRQRTHRTPGTRPLSLKVYMWYDVREGIKSADETSSVVGLQRVLVLKRLESSPVAFLITLLRLAVLHAHRLQQLLNLCLEVGNRDRSRTLEAELKALLDKQPNDALDKIRYLATADNITDPRVDFIKALSRAYSDSKPAADTDDPPPQLSLFAESEEGSPQREQLDRLWTLREALLDDLATLFEVTPDLADIIFGRFARAEWPRRFIAGGEEVDWPRSAAGACGSSPMPSCAVWWGVWCWRVAAVRRSLSSHSSAIPSPTSSRSCGPARPSPVASGRWSCAAARTCSTCIRRKSPRCWPPRPPSRGAPRSGMRWSTPLPPSTASVPTGR